MAGVVVAAAVLVLALGACDDNDDDGDPPVTPTTVPPPTTTAKPPPPTTAKPPPPECGINYEIDRNTNKCKLIDGDPSRCVAGTTYDHVSKLCVNTVTRDDRDVTQPTSYCESPYEFHDGTQCRVKQRNDDPERSKHCPAGMVFYSTLGCKCPPGTTCGNPVNPTNPTTPTNPDDPDDPDDPVNPVNPPPPPVVPVVSVFGLGGVVEGDEARFVLLVSPAFSADTDVTVHMSETEDMALVPPGIRHFTVSAGATQRAFVIHTDDDTVVEPDSVFTADVLAGSGYTLGAPTLADVSVADNDSTTVVTLPSVTVTASSTVTVVEGADAVFTLTASPAPSADLDVTLSVAEYLASHADAAHLGTGVVTIPAGAGSKDVAVPTIDDNVQEADSLIVATVGSDPGYRAASPSLARVDVQDNDGSVSVLYSTVVQAARDACHAPLAAGDPAVTGNSSPPQDWPGWPGSNPAQFEGGALASPPDFAIQPVEPAEPVQPPSSDPAYPFWQVAHAQWQRDHDQWLIDLEHWKDLTVEWARRWCVKPH